MTYEDFERIFMGVLNCYAPMKKKLIRENHQLKKLNKSISNTS